MGFLNGDTVNLRQRTAQMLAKKRAGEFVARNATTTGPVEASFTTAPPATPAMPEKAPQATVESTVTPAAPATSVGTYVKEPQAPPTQMDWGEARANAQNARQMRLRNLAQTRAKIQLTRGI